MDTPDWPPPPPRDASGSTSPESSIVHINFDSGTLKRMLTVLPDCSPDIEPIYAYALPYAGEHTSEQRVKEPSGRGVTEKGNQSCAQLYTEHIICDETDVNSPLLSTQTSSSLVEDCSNYQSVTPDIIESSSPVVRLLPGDRLTALPAG